MITKTIDMSEYNVKLYDALKATNYLIIPNFVNEGDCEWLHTGFKYYCEYNNIGGDGQVSESSSVYNFPMFTQLLVEKTKQISDLLKVKVLPTYSYARIYHNGSVLNPHRDRPQCEISISCHLNGDSEWSFFIEDPKGDAQELKLSRGDAVIYLGNEATHWREQYTGESYTQVFLHYVRTYGEHSNLYFDRCP